MAGLLTWLMSKGDTAKRNLRAIARDPVGMLDLMAQQTAEDIRGTKYEREQDQARLRGKPYDKAAVDDLDRKRQENMLSLALTFAGPLAKTADKGLLARAQEMTKAGENPFKVWQETGWTDQFPDGKWRFEISDDWASMRVPRTEGKAGKYISHVDLQEAYPSVNDVNLIRDYRLLRNEGSFLDNEIRIGGTTEAGHKQKGVLLHELQHKIQKDEGFARGGSPEGLPEALSRDADKLRSKARQLIDAGDRDAGLALEAQARKLDSITAWGELAPHELYRRLAGEAEARLVEKRMNYTPEMRRAVAPWQQFDPPIDQQIVRFGDGPAMSVGADDLSAQLEAMRAANKAKGLPLETGTGDLRNEIARRNAAGMLGLPETNTAADRARAMGFKDGLLHGGTNDFDAFMVSGRSNVYATDSPNIADVYANATGRHKALREINAEPNVIPLMYRGDLLEISDLGPGGGGWSTDNLAAALGTEPRRGLYKEVQKKGFSGVKINDMNDLGGTQAQYVFPQPNVLRSRFAAFDPARRNESDLLAGLLPYAIPAGLLGLILTRQGEGHD